MRGGQKQEMSITQTDNLPGTPPVGDNNQGPPIMVLVIAERGLNVTYIIDLAEELGTA